MSISQDTTFFIKLFKLSNNSYGKLEQVNTMIFKEDVGRILFLNKQSFGFYSVSIYENYSANNNI